MRNLDTLEKRASEAQLRYENVARMHTNAIVCIETAHDSKDTIAAKLMLSRVHSMIDESFLLEKCLKEIKDQAAAISAFEKESGIEFDALGPPVALCGFCDKFFQYVPDHLCKPSTCANLEKDLTPFDNDPALQALAPPTTHQAPSSQSRKAMTRLEKCHPPRWGKNTPIDNS
jgi:hypothetical protein